MFKSKSCKFIMLSVVAILTVGMTSTVQAAEYMTDEQIEQVTASLNNNDYVIPTPDGGLIKKIDGSNTFNKEQITLLGEPMTVAEYKEHLETFDISFEKQTVTQPSPFRSASVPTNVRILWANDMYLSNPFSASGWRYGELKFVPAFGTGDYLYWQAFLDSGRVEDGRGVSMELFPGQYLAVYSRRGTYFKTYNPVAGSQYQVTNPV